MKVYEADNPPAEVSSSVSVHATFFPINAYSPAPGCSHSLRVLTYSGCWATGIRAGDTFTIAFLETHTVSRVVGS